MSFFYDHWEMNDKHRGFGPIVENLQTLEILQHVYKDNNMYHTRVFEWPQKFKNDLKAGR